MHILDNELRLITPTDLEGVESASPVAAAPGELGALTQPRSPDRYYQLTHDYLVHSLRDWLTRKQRETRRGRAELRLAERSGLWNAKPENRHLPTLWEWLGIRTLTDPKKWTSPQRVMMSKATRLHSLRSALAMAGLVALISIGAVVRTQVAREQEATRIEGLVGRLVSAEPNQLPVIVKELDGNPKVAATYAWQRLHCRQCHPDGRTRSARLHVLAACGGFPRPGGNGRTTAGRAARNKGRLRRPDSSASCVARRPGSRKNSAAHPAGRESRGQSPLPCGGGGWWITFPKSEAA